MNAKATYEPETMNLFNFNLGDTARKVEQLSTDLKIVGIMLYGLVWYIIFRLAS